MIEPRLLKGFPDFDPPQQAARQEMFRKIQAVFERFGFLPLSTPALEYKETLTGKAGEEEKLMYSFKDKGDRDVALRYDLTVPLARYVAQNQNRLTFPFKRYQIAPVWRADKPQKGRWREFYQCDIDVAGIVSPAADAEVVACVYQALLALGLSDCEIRFNNRLLFYRLFSVDDKEVQLVLREVDKVNKVGKDEVMKRLQESGLSQQGLAEAAAVMELGQGEQALQNIAASFPKAADFADPSGPTRGFARLAEQFGVPAGSLVFDPLLVRGLDYYTNLIFEIGLKGKPEFGSIAAGGRYDGLVSQFSRTDIPAVGGSIGIDRLFDAMAEQGLIAGAGLIKALVVNFEQIPLVDYIGLVTQLRNAGINSELYYEPEKLDKQLKYASAKDIEYAVIMGADEQAKDVVQLKNLRTREQREVKQAELISLLTE